MSWIQWGGVLGRFYCLNEAIKIRKELDRRFWEDHDAKIDRIIKSQME